MSSCASRPADSYTSRERGGRLCVYKASSLGRVHICVWTVRVGGHLRGPGSMLMQEHSSMGTVDTSVRNDRLSRWFSLGASVSAWRRLTDRTEFQLERCRSRQAYRGLLSRPFSHVRSVMVDFMDERVTQRASQCKNLDWRRVIDNSTVLERSHMPQHLSLFLGCCAQKCHLAHG